MLFRSHWQQQNRLICRRGSHGHATPAELQPAAGEWIQHKHGFSGFTNGELAQHLRKLGATQLVLAGVHLRACIRSAATDAYQQGWQVWIASGAKPLPRKIVVTYRGDEARPQSISLMITSCAISTSRRVR